MKSNNNSLINNFVMFLFSEKANYLTGQVYTYGTYKH